jgi:hypothetical protein
VTGLFVTLYECELNVGDSEQFRADNIELIVIEAEIARVVRELDDAYRRVRLDPLLAEWPPGVDAGALEYQFDLLVVPTAEAQKSQKIFADCTARNTHGKA